MISGLQKVIKEEALKMHQENFDNASEQSSRCLSEIYFCKF